MESTKKNFECLKIQWVLKNSLIFLKSENIIILQPFISRFNTILVIVLFDFIYKYIPKNFAFISIYKYIPKSVSFISATVTRKEH